jgi:hypothetical protein
MVSTLLQRLTVNFSGTTRRVKYRGVDYLVAPMTLINPGVLNGSKGSLLYPPDEVAKNPRAWNGVPIVVYHPHHLGQPVSAKFSGVIDRQGIGVVKNATSRGKLQAEGWFDLAKTKQVNPGVYSRLMSHEPIELSTGLYTDNEEQSGTFNGRQYVAVARNYRPDHLAILPDQVGACSIKDGCGVLVNSNSLQQKLRLLSNAFCPTGEGHGQDNSCSSKDTGDQVLDEMSSSKDGRGKSTFTKKELKESQKALLEGRLKQYLVEKIGEAKSAGDLNKSLTLEHAQGILTGKFEREMARERSKEDFVAGSWKTFQEQVKSKAGSLQKTSWFSGSKVSKNSRPVVIYHQGFGKSESLTPEKSGGLHFGSLGQASRASSQHVMEGTADDSKKMTHAAVLSIKNPKRVKDAVDARGWQQEILQAKKEGYDGLVYQNQFEGGKDSYVPFSRKQIKFLGSFKSSSGKVTNKENQTPLQDKLSLLVNSNVGSKLKAIRNGFCPTGQGGGQDNSCGGGSSIPVDASGNGNPDAKKYPHLAHLMNGQRMGSTGHDKKTATAKARSLRASGVYASVLKDPEGKRGAQYMVMLPASLPVKNEEGQMSVQDKLQSLLSPTANVVREIEEGKFRLYSHDGKNLGTFDSEEEAKDHERDVQYFKREDNCSAPDEENCSTRVLNQGGKKVEDSRLILLKTDNPREIAEDAEDHDMINGEAKSPQKKVKSSAEKYSGLRDAEEDNEDTVKNALAEKLESLTGNWGGPPQGPPPQGPPRPPVPPRQPPQQPSVGPPPQAGLPQPPVNPEVWLQRQIALLVTKFKEMSGASRTSADPLPVTRNKEGGPTMADVKLTENERKTVVDGLIANAECCWDESDREVLNSLGDVVLAKLTKQQELVKNAGIPEELQEDDGEDVAVEGEKTKKGQSVPDGKVAPFGELEPKMKNNSSTLSPQDREVLAFGYRQLNQIRKGHIARITANANNKFTAKQLETMSGDMLANLAELARTPVANYEGNDAMTRPNFFGAQGAADFSVNADPGEEPLTLGRIDFKELAANGKK